jgi:predicted O-methyltransferase YrrM
MPRYRQLADLVRTYGSETIVEVGTWNGGRAIEMSLASFETKDKVHYIGFDLFEEAT